MSAAAKDKAAEQQWLNEQAHVVHDENDTATDPEPLVPVMKALAGWAAILVGGALLAALLLHALKSSVSP